MGYHSSYLRFHIALGIIGVITYLLLVYYVIPQFVLSEKHAIASNYTNYAFSAYLAILTIGSLTSQYFDTRIISEDPSSGPNGGRRKRR